MAPPLSSARLISHPSINEGLVKAGQRFSELPGDRNSVGGDGRDSLDMNRIDPWLQIVGLRFPYAKNDPLPENLMSYQTGLSGLNAASNDLDVIGNNIANANTVGFKSGQAQFSDLY